MAFRAVNVIAAALLLLGGLEGAGAQMRGAVAAAGADAHPVATDSRVAGDEKHTRFVVDLSRKIELRAFTLADPYRVVIDLPQVTFKLPAKAGETGRGLVKAYRFGVVMPGGSRIVLDTGKPVRVEKAFVLDPAAGQPARLVLDLVATDRESFLRNVALENKPAAPAYNGPKAEPVARGETRPLIVLDPGHGGIDNGTRSGNGDAEKTIVLDFSLLLRDLLEKSGKYRIVMTRSDDTFIPLAERVRIARQREASLFISIHADALRKGEGEAQGATVYTLSEDASDAEAARLAENENRADVIAGIDLSHESGDVADILIDLAQRETKIFSMHMARDLVTELRRVARMHKNPMKSAGFKVLKAPDVPSVLLELGYVSSKDDLKQLMSAQWRAKTANAVVAAVDAFFNTRLAGSPAGGR